MLRSCLPPTCHSRPFLRPRSPFPLLAPHPTSACCLAGLHGLALPAGKPDLASSCPTVIPSTHSPRRKELRRPPSATSERRRVRSPTGSAKGPGAHATPALHNYGELGHLQPRTTGHLPGHWPEPRRHPELPSSCHNLSTCRAGGKLCRRDTGCFALLSGSDVGVC